MTDAKIDAMKGAMIDVKGGMKVAINGKMRDATKGKMTDAKGGMRDVTKGKMKDVTKGKMTDGKGGMKVATKGRMKDATKGKMIDVKGGMKDVMKGEIKGVMTGAKGVMRDVTKSRIKDRTKEQINPKNMFHPLKSQKIQGKVSISLQKGNKDHQLKDHRHPKKGVSLLKNNSNLKFQPRDQQQKVHPKGKEANLLLERDHL